jgi:O-antigen/teichoic acid export membrane protein
MALFRNRESAAGGHGWRSRLQEHVLQHFRSGILHNAAWMLSGRSLALAGRMVYFVIVAHVLGPAGYGTFVACTALMAIMSPFASFGTGHVMVKYGARDRNALPIYLGNALLVTAGFGSLLTLLVLFVRPMVLPASVTMEMLVVVAIAELLGTQMTNLCRQTFQALDQGRRFAQLLAIATGARLLAALLLLAASTRTPTAWAYLYAASSALTLIVGLFGLSRYGALPRLQLGLIFPSLREGAQFATVEASQSIYCGIDKTMLARLSSVEAAAIYAVANRFIDTAMLPVGSLAEATYPEFFRKGMHGVASTFAFARRIIRRSFVYGIAAAVIMFLAAQLVPLIMGRAYVESAAALRWLCFLPLLRSGHSFLTDTLTGAGHQLQRTLLDAGAAVFNVGLNLWIIRAYAWRGAAWSSATTELLFIAMLYVTIRWYLRREQAAVASAPQPVFAAGGE